MFLIAWIFITIIFTILLNKTFLNSDRKNINKITYLETVEVNGEKKTIRKPMCPICGNKDLSYQIVSDAAISRNVNSNTTSTHIHKSKHAICDKCGKSFEVKTEPSYILSFIIALCVSSIFSLIVIFVVSLLFIF